MTVGWGWDREEGVSHLRSGWGREHRLGAPTCLPGAPKVSNSLTPQWLCTDGSVKETPTQMHEHVIIK